MSYNVVIDNVSKKFGNKSVLEGINLKLDEGKIIGFVSPNGSGKTTLIKMMADFMTLDSGSITIAGKKVGHESKAVVSYLPDHSVFEKSTKISKAVKFYSDCYSDFDKQKCDKYLKMFKINPENRFGEISKGNAEILMLILTLCRDCKLYLLDEPLASVDPVNREAVIGTILKEYREDATVVISTHLLNDVEAILDEVVMIRDNRIYCHKSVEDIRSETGKSLNDFFKDSFRIDWFGGDKNA